MANEISFEKRVEEIREDIKKLQDEFSKEVIEQTATRLEGFSYAPPVITPTASFLRLDKQGLLEEVDRILALPEEEACALAPGNTQKCEDLRLEFLRVILFYYEKLLQLRGGDVEEWDEIDELLIHD